jgi:hypothetical protein
MSRQIIERAAGSATPEDIAAKLARAPEWVRRMIARGSSAPSTPKQKPTATPRAEPTARAKAPVVGWLYGAACPGVSRPCLCHTDGERLPETLTPAAMRGILDQVRRVSGPGVPLTFGHGGLVLARSGDLDLTFSYDERVGLEFCARLRKSHDVEKLLESIGSRGVGVSIGFSRPKTWHVERSGFGRLRVIDSAVLHHIALVIGDNRRSAYEGARAFAERSTSVGPSDAIRKEARLYAFDVIRRQAGA